MNSNQQKIEQFSNQLKPFLPQQTEEYVARFLIDKVVHFTVSKKRKTKLGDYRQPHDGKPHRISVNGSLNKYAFLVTTLHEMAHLTTFEKFGNRVKPHGEEWKSEFKTIFQPLLERNILPDDVYQALTNYLANAKASSCTDDRLYRVLKRYDANPGLRVEQLEIGSKFTIEGRTFIKGKKLRKRHECTDVTNGRTYRVLGVAEIDKLINEE
ncbi:MAG: SprT-like domain-containing protein [Flavobacteriales bacterium]|nr:SprT-like domain-containing protein [Flavobacteriales bacterium]